VIAGYAVGSENGSAQGPVADAFALPPQAHGRSILRKLDLPSAAGENRRVHAVLAFLGS